MKTRIYKTNIKMIIFLLFSTFITCNIVNGPGTKKGNIHLNKEVAFPIVNTITPTLFVINTPNVSVEINYDCEFTSVPTISLIHKTTSTEIPITITRIIKTVVRFMIPTDLVVNEGFYIVRTTVNEQTTASKIGIYGMIQDSSPKDNLLRTLPEETSSLINFPLFLSRTVIFADSKNIQDSVRVLFFHKLNPLIIGNVRTDGSTPFTFTFQTEALDLKPITPANPVYDKYERIDFYDKENKNILFTLKQTFRIIKKEDFPSKILNSTPVLEKDNTFIIEFDKNDYPEYEEDFDIEESLIKRQCIVKAYDLTDTNNKLKINCPFLEKSKFHFKISILPLNLKFEITLSCGGSKYFDKQRYSCQPCSAMNAIWEDPTCKKCENKVPNADMTQCVDCFDYFDQQTLKCVTTCPANTFEYQKVCYQSCSAETLPDNLYIEGNHCVTECSEEKVIDPLTPQCIPIQITSKTNSDNFVVNEIASFEIRFNSNVTNKINEIKIFKPEEQKLLCTQNSDNEALFSCKEISFVGFKAETYFIQGYNKSMPVTNKFAIKLQSVIITDFDTVILEVPLTTATSIVISFNGVFDLSTYRIQFYDVDKNTNIEVNGEMKYKAQGLITFTLPKTFNTQGLFRLRTINSQNESLDLSNKTLFCYSNDLMVTPTDSMKVIQGSTISSIVFDVNIESFKSQIKTIKLLTPTTSQEITSFYIKNKKLIINHSITFTALKGYSLEIIEQIPYTYYFSFKITQLKIPSFVTYNPVFYYSEKTPSFEIQFNDGFDDISIFGNIISISKSENKYEIKLLIKQSEKDSKKYELFLADPTSSLIFNQEGYAGIVFYDKFNSKDSLVNNEQELLILNDETIPFKLKSYEYFSSLDSKMKSLFTDIFIYDSVLKYITSNDDRINNFETRTDDESKQLQINFKGEGLPPTNTTISITSFGHPVEIKISFIHFCDSPAIQDPDRAEKKCITCAQYKGGKYPYYHDKKCHQKCPNKTVLHASSNVCFDYCFQETPYKTLRYGHTCLYSHECLGFVFEDLLTCYDTCPTKYQGSPLFAGDHKCLFTCGKDEVPNELNVCVKPKDKTCLNTDTKLQCIEKCPPGTEFSNNKCVLPSSTNGITVQCSTSDCKSGGICSVVNNQKQASCPTGTYGLTCEIREADVPKTVNQIIFDLIEYDIINIQHPAVFLSILSINSIYKSNPKLLEDSLFKQEYVLELNKVISKCIILYYIVKTIKQSPSLSNELTSLISLGLKSSLIQYVYHL